MVCVDKANIFKILLSLPNFFKEGLLPLNIAKTVKIEKAAVETEGKFYYHIDGEPREADCVLNISICKAAIRLLTL
jgi:diacylglycerol kinase family enzyme